jgi:Tol biopolymer transport system component
LFRGTIDLEVEGQVWALMGPGAVLSPDGRTLAVVVDRPGKANQVFIRRLDQDTASPVAGTEGARNIFFSPDGQSLGFFADGKLKRIAVAGGTATTLADAVEDRGGYWAADNSILFAPTARTTIRRVPAAGGAVEEVTRLAAGDAGHRWPQWLPEGRGVMYTVVRSDGASEAVAVDPLDGSDRRIVQDPGFFGRYVPSGHLIFMRRDATLMAAGMDLVGLTLTSPAVPVLNDVRYGIGPAGAQVAISDSGSAVYLKGGLKGGAWNMIWFDRNGVERPLASERANYRDPRLSPDGTKVASTKARADNDIWIFDIERGTDSRLTFENTSEVDPVWTPDGRHVTYAVISLEAPNAVYWKRADGTGNPQLLVRDEAGLIPFSWHPNGKVLALIRQLPGNTTDVVTTEFTGDERSGLKAGPIVPFAASRFGESEPAFSPDGRWLAYQSNESGRYEIYVSGYPGPTGRWQISNAAGLFPTWGADGRTLYYRSPEQQIMMVTYEVTNGAFSASVPQLWAPTRLDDLGMVVRTFDVHPDGQRMLGLRMPPDDRETSVTVTLFTNFFDELRRHVTLAR